MEKNDIIFLALKALIRDPLTPNEIRDEINQAIEEELARRRAIDEELIQDKQN